VFQKYKPSLVESPPAPAPPLAAAVLVAAYAVVVAVTVFSASFLCCLATLLFVLIDYGDALDGGVTISSFLTTAAVLHALSGVLSPRLFVAVI